MREIAANAGRRPYYGWVVVGTLATTETISWGILYYAFSAFLVPMQRELGWSTVALATSGIHPRRPILGDRKTAVLTARLPAPGSIEGGAVSDPAPQLVTGCGSGGAARLFAPVARTAPLIRVSSVRRLGAPGPTVFSS